MGVVEGCATQVGETLKSFLTGSLGSREGCSWRRGWPPKGCVCDVKGTWIGETGGARPNGIVGWDMGGRGRSTREGDGRRSPGRG